MAVLLIATIEGILYAMIFNKIGAQRIVDGTDTNIAKNAQVQQNYVGMVFFICMDNFMMSAVA